jgi:hypothetical protein
VAKILVPEEQFRDFGFWFLVVCFVCLFVFCSTGTQPRNQFQK